MLPPPSAPNAMGTIPAETALPLPLLLPPVRCDVLYGLRALPVHGLWPLVPIPISCMFVIPTIIAPAARSLATGSASLTAMRVMN